MNGYNEHDWLYHEGLIRDGAIVGIAGSALIDVAHRGSAPALSAVLTRCADLSAIAMFALGQYRRAFARHSAPNILRTPGVI
jgi:hypothetical protein